MRVDREAASLALQRNVIWVGLAVFVSLLTPHDPVFRALGAHVPGLGHWLLGVAGLLAIGVVAAVRDYLRVTAPDVLASLRFP